MTPHSGASNDLGCVLAAALFLDAVGCLGIAASGAGGIHTVALMIELYKVTPPAPTVSTAAEQAAASRVNQDSADGFNSASGHQSAYCQKHDPSTRIIAQALAPDAGFRA